ncbi:MAG: serine/threonine protein kinase, partial [Clostridia bacterium]|nr:serine/threonine protein kinase [Clostridia bacterium]
QPEQIEWLVLARESNKALVISKYALDCQPYNTSHSDVTWETCSLRKWLNETFLSAAFNSEEQSSIISSTVTADKNPSYSTSPGNNTTDKVFLLSITEASKYFKSDEARKCALTDYAIAQGAWASASYKTDFWRLRSPGDDSIYAAYVDSGGSVDCLGDGVSRNVYGVRPALWIDLGS